jgi:hypothetical protein
VPVWLGSGEDSSLPGCFTFAVPSHSRRGKGGAGSLARKNTDPIHKGSAPVISSPIKGPVPMTGFQHEFGGTYIQTIALIL